MKALNQKKTGDSKGGGASGTKVRGKEGAVS